MPAGRKTEINGFTGFSWNQDQPRSLPSSLQHKYTIAGILVLYLHRETMHQSTKADGGTPCGTEHIGYCSESNYAIEQPILLFITLHRKVADICNAGSRLNDLNVTCHIRQFLGQYQIVMDPGWGAGAGSSLTPLSIQRPGCKSAHIFTWLCSSQRAAAFPLVCSLVAMLSPCWFIIVL